MNPSAPRGYILVQKIGSGAFASVWRGIESSTKKDVAIKIISKQKVRDKSVVMNEVKILKEIKKINNKGLIDFIDFKDDLKNYFIITELYLNGSLTNKIRQAGILSENSARHIFIQVASALRCLHEELQIAHRDVKLDNIVFDDDNNAKLIDFGLSIEYTNASPYLSHACGSPKYAAPELFNGGLHIANVDIWALGVILYHMLVGRFPFEDGGDYDGLSGLQALVARIEKEEPQFPHFLSDEAKHIIRRMLTKDPQKRATWDELFSHDWVQEQLLHVKSHAITARILSKNSTPTNKLLPPKSSPNSPQHFTRNNDSTPPPNGARIEFAPSVYLEVKKFNSTHLTPKSPEEIKPNDNETIKEIANENNNYKDQNDCRNYLDDKNNSIESSDSTNPPTIPSIPKSSRSPKHSPEGVKTDSKDNYNMNDNEDDNFSNGRKLANAIRNKICAKRRKSEFTVLRNFADEVRRNRLLSDEKSDNETSSSIIDKLCATGKFRRKNASNSGTEEKDNQIEPHFATTEINGESRK